MQGATQPTDAATPSVGGVGWFTATIRRKGAGWPRVTYLCHNGSVPVESRCGSGSVLLHQPPNVMASIRYGGGVVDARGSIAGNTLSRNASGAYSRARVAPTNPGTSPQAAVRDALSLSSQNWRELTDTQREAWIDAAATVQGKYTNRLGQEQQYTGQQLWMKVQMARQAWALGGGTLVGSGEDPPPLTPSPPAVAIASLTAETAGGTTIDLLELDVTGADVANQLLVYASPPVSAGTMRPRSVRFKLIGAFEDWATGNESILTEYAAVYGTAANDGEKIFVQVKRISTTSWREASPLVLSDVLVTGV